MFDEVNDLFSQWMEETVKCFSQLRFSVMSQFKPRLELCFIFSCDKTAKWPNLSGFAQEPWAVVVYSAWQIDL